MAIAGIELKYLTNRISDETREYYVSNIYGIDRDSVLFKLHHPEKPDIFMVLSTMGMWITASRIQQIAENRLVRRLRRDLLRTRIARVEQPGLERLACITFQDFERRFVLVGEFFGDGNIVLCNGEMKVLALQHSIDVRHRSLRVGVQYERPPQPAIDLLGIEPDDIAGIRDADMPCARWIGRNLGLPKRYAEGIPRMANVDPKKPGVSLGADDASALYDAAKRLASDILDGNHTPARAGGGPEVVPVDIWGEPGASPAGDYMAELDAAFTEAILERGRDAGSGEAKNEARELQNRLAEQERAVRTVQERHARITKVADSMYAILASGSIRLDTDEARAILERNGASMAREKGVPTIRVVDERIKVNLDAPLQSTASLLYGEAKRQSAAVPAIQKAMEKTRRMLEKASGRQRAQMRSVTATRVRKRNWFERYRWFYTSDGSLVVGGRDAPSNSAVVRKHVEDSDRVFHAQIFGSPFFILKRAEPSAADILETAQATVCFSRAWREGMFGASAFWVNPDQVKKSAPSGQYLPKGSFTIEGQRNFVGTSAMRLALGMVPEGDENLLMCGPVDSVAGRASPYITIEPSGLDMVAAAKRVRTEFLGMEVPGTDKYTVDDFVRVLPAGRSRVAGVHRG